MYNIETLLDKLINEPIENEVLEFKTAEKQFDKEKLGKYFSALSNEANLKRVDSAWLVLGVDDARNIVGTQISERQIDEFKQYVYTKTSPKTSFVNDYKINRAGRNVILLEIAASPQGIPMSWDGHYYGRSGSSLVALGDMKYELIRRENKITDWSSAIIEEASLDDLSSEAIAKAREEYTKKHKYLSDSIAKWDDLTFLNKAKICIGGKITRTAILLLGKGESDHYLSPGTSKISWILKSKENIEKDYEHFFCPLLLQVDKVRNKIRNLKYRYIADNSLFPDEVNQYEDYSIREALNNCIAHQDYSQGGKVNVIENEDGYLVFSNLGAFIPGSVEEVIRNDSPSMLYRNPFLANAMVNLGMIDTIGSGIKKMFLYQKEKYFPLPDYNLANNMVLVKLYGRILDINYAKKLAEVSDLNLDEVILLDKVSKGICISQEEAKILKRKKYIEGRRPNYIISSSVAKQMKDEVRYIKEKGLDDRYYLELVIQYLRNFGSAKRKDLDNLLFSKLPDVLDENQKHNKVKNLLQNLKNKKIIKVGAGKTWILDEV